MIVVHGGQKIVLVKLEPTMHNPFPILLALRSSRVGVTIKFYRIFTDCRLRLLDEVTIYYGNEG